MIASTGTTATDIYTELCATIDMGLVEDFIKAFDANWETGDLKDVASSAAFSFVNDVSDTGIVKFFYNGIDKGDPATLDAFAEFNASEYLFPTIYLQDVANCYFYNKILDQYINNLAAFALIAAANWVEDKHGSNYKLCAGSIRTAAKLAAQGDAKPKAIAYTLRS